MSRIFIIENALPEYCAPRDAWVQIVFSKVRWWVAVRLPFSIRERVVWMESPDPRRAFLRLGLTVWKKRTCEARWWAIWAESLPLTREATV